MDILISFVNQNFTPEYVLGILKQGKDFAWVKGKISQLSNGITGLTINKDKLYVAFQQNGLGVIDSKFNLIQHVQSDNILDPHSICIYDNQLYVVSTGKNSIYRYDIKKSGHLTNETLYWKVPDVGLDYDYVHLNSLIISKSKSYVTMFGKREKGQSWSEVKQGKLINIDTNEILLDGLNQPHSLLMMDNEDVLFCESSLGLLKTERGEILHKFDGYIRGIYKFKNQFIIAENARRKLSKSTISDIRGRIREFEENSVTSSNIYFMSSKKFKLLKKINMSDYGNEIYDLIPIDSSIFSYESKHIAHSKNEARSKTIEDKLVGVLIEGERKIEESNKKLNEANALIENKSMQLQQLQKELDESKIQLRKQEHLIEELNRDDNSDISQIEVSGPEVNNNKGFRNDKSMSSAKKNDDLSIGKMAQKSLNTENYNIAILNNELSFLKESNNRLNQELEQFQNLKKDFFELSLEKEKIQVNNQLKVQDLTNKFEQLSKQNSRLAEKQKTLLTQVKSKEIEIKNLIEKKKEYKKTKKLLKKKLDGTSSYVNSLLEENKRLTEIEANFNNALTENKKLKENIRGLNERVSQTEVEKNQFLEKTSEQEKVISDLKNVLITVEEDKNKLKVGKDQLKSTIESLLNQKNELHLKNGNLTEENNQLQNQLKGIKEINSGLSKSNEELNLRISKLEDDKSNLKLQLTNNQEENNKLQRKLNDLQNENLTLIDQGQRLNNALQDADSIQNNLQLQINKLYKEIKKKDELIFTKNEDIENIKQIQNKLDKKFHTQKRKRKLEKKQFNKSYNSALNSIKSYKVATREQKNIIATLSENENKLKNENKDLRLNISELNQETIELQEKLDGSIAQLNKKIEQSNQLEKLYNESQINVRSYINDNETLRVEISDTRNSLTKFTQENDQLKNVIQSLHSDIHLLKQGLDKKSEDLNNSNEKLNALVNNTNYLEGLVNDARIEIKNHYQVFKSSSHKLKLIEEKYNNLKIIETKQLSDLEKQAKELNKLNHKINELNDELNYKNQIIDSNSSKLVRQTEQISNLRYDLEQKEENNINLLNEIDNIKDSYSFRLGYRLTGIINASIGWLPFVKSRTSKLIQ